MSRWSAAVTKRNCDSAVTEQHLTVGGSKSVAVLGNASSQDLMKCNHAKKQT